MSKYMLLGLLFLCMRANAQPVSWGVPSAVRPPVRMAPRPMVRVIRPMRVMPAPTLMPSGVPRPFGVSGGPVLRAPDGAPPPPPAPRCFPAAAPPLFGTPTPRPAINAPVPHPMADPPVPPVRYGNWNNATLRQRAQVAADKSLRCGPNCKKDRAGTFGRGAWESDPKNPHVIYEAHSIRCRAPGCGRVATAAIGADGKWLVNTYKPDTTRNSAERDERASVPPPTGRDRNVARDALFRANDARINAGKPGYKK